jgi:hypothetical protein
VTKKQREGFFLLYQLKKRRKRIQLLNNEYGQKSLYALMVSIVNVNPPSVPTWIISPGPLSFPILIRSSRRLLSIVDLTSNPMKPKINLCYYNHIWREKDMKRKGQFKWRGEKRATLNKFSNSYTQGIEILS